MNRVIYGITSPTRQAKQGSHYYGLPDGGEVAVWQVTTTPDETLTNRLLNTPDAQCIGPVTTYLRSESSMMPLPFVHN